MLDKNADDLADLYAPDAVHEFPLLSPFFPKRLNGREEIRAHYRAAWGAAAIRLLDIREVAVHETRDPLLIVAEAEYTALATASGKSFDLSFLIVMKVEGALIVHLRDYMDALGAAFALDRLPNMIKALESRRSTAP
jgi:ketosteroid isomerase-like protein